MKIHIDLVRGLRAAPAAAAERALEAAVEVPEVTARLPGAEPRLTLKLTADDELRRLNHRFLGWDEVTDVLSFPAGEPAPGEAFEPAYLGDIVISWPAAQRQALEFGHSPETELGLLAVHGLLHLLGWDHADGPGEREMTRLTSQALRLAGTPPAPERLPAP